jgi:hypothetical protein
VAAVAAVTIKPSAMLNLRRYSILIETLDSFAAMPWAARMISRSLVPVSRIVPRATVRVNASTINGTSHISPRCS